MPATTPKLFSPLTLGGKHPVQLQHRVVMAPLTRLRTGESGVPTDLVAEYYAQRSTPGGLIIAEATNISATARGYFGAPGLFTREQVEGWKKVTSAVHAQGAKLFVQLWHTGRVGHPLNQPNEELPVSSSAVGLEGVKTSAVTREGRRKYVTPRALKTHEVAGVVADYKRAAENAIAAGFDGVELHGANGYFIEQFLCDSVNKRTDRYGGSIENRTRLMLEALDAVLSSLDSSQVAIRLSPFGVTFGCTDSNPAETYGYVLKKLSALDLAYVHIVEPRAVRRRAHDVVRLRPRGRHPRYGERLGGLRGVRPAVHLEPGLGAASEDWRSLEPLGPQDLLHACERPALAGIHGLPHARAQVVAVDTAEINWAWDRTLKLPFNCQ
jgi:N-ethylmaleimide reductase